MPEPLWRSPPDSSLEPPRWHEGDVQRFLDVLEGFTAVVLGVIGPDGHLRRANAGFRRLITNDETTNATAPHGDVRQHLVRPSYAELTAAPPTAGQLVYHGPVTFLDRSGVSRSVRAIALRFDDELVLFGEHDLAEYEQLIHSLTELNGELAETQRELVRAKRDLERVEAAQRELAATDPLTGLHNRRYVLERLAAETDRAKRGDARVSIVLLDLDDLKGINDRQGHAAGDAALKAVAEVLRSLARSYDVPARFAGDEWLLLLPDTTADDALLVARRAVAAARGLRVAGHDVPVRLSAGVAGLADAEETPEQLLLPADRALYRAKGEGRDRAVLADARDTHDGSPLA